MKIRAMIIDDEKPARDIIRHYLKSREEVEITGEADNGFDAFKLIGDLSPDVIFLDVQMPKLTGFELLDILDDPPFVIFTTAYDQYALRAFEVNALDYLLKPFDQERLYSALDKVIEKLQTKEETGKSRFSSLSETSDDEINRVVVKKGKAVRILRPDEILYITAEDDYVMIYTSEERYLKHRTMKYLETHLPPNFIRIHRSSIININFVSEVQPYKKDTLVVKMKNNEYINASQAGSIKLRKCLR